MKTDTVNVQQKFDSPAYKRSRAAYMAQCTFEYFISILVADAFLAKLLANIGISDALIGIISSFITLAFLFQLLAIFVARKIKNTKRTVILFDTISSFMWLLMYIIPFTPFSLPVKTVIVIGDVLVYYLLKYLVQSVLYKWANSYVEPKKRASYSAVKEMISLVTGIAFTMVAGFIIDKYEAVGNIEGGFLLISVVILILAICNFVSLLMIKNEPIKTESQTGHSFKDIMRNTLGNRNFVNVIIMTVLYDVARYMTVGFLGVFKTKDLLLTVGTVQIINNAGNLLRLCISMPFGRYSDRKSYASGLKLAYIMAAVAFGINMFTSQNTWWLIVIYTVLYNSSMAGSNQNSFNIAYSYVNADYFVYASAIKNSIGGIFGFMATIVGSRILSYVQASGNMLFGIHVYGQQLLSGISFIMMIVTVLFVHFVIEKQKVMKQ